MLSERILTSAFVLVWYLAASGLFGVCVFVVSFNFRQIAPATKRQTLVLSSLVIAALVIGCAYRWFGLKLIFPLYSQLGGFELFGRCSLPGFVLFVCSGTPGALLAEIQEALRFWQPKAFVRFARSQGFSLRRVLRPVIVPKALCEVWQISLPWVCAEMFLVEAVFNAPGLGLDAWYMARERRFFALGTDLGVLLGIYSGLVWLNQSVRARIGQRLACYD